MYIYIYIHVKDKCARPAIKRVIFGGKGGISLFNICKKKGNKGEAKSDQFSKK